jgi:hypothetical protein
MAEIHSPDIYGSIRLAGDAGAAGRVLKSSGAGAQAIWGAVAPSVFTFTSAAALSHTITHNLGNQFPAVTVYNTAGNAAVTPASMVGTSINVLTITFAVPTAIAGTIVG